MILGDIKKTAYALIDEYSSDENTGTEDEDISNKINLVVNICYHELSSVKPIIRMIAIDRSAAQDEEYYRAYDLPTDMKKLIQIVAFDTITNKPIQPEYRIEYGVSEVSGQTTTYKDKVYVNDLAEGNYFIKYEAYPTDITNTTEDTFVLEIDRDAQMLLPFAIASDILKADPSSDYAVFRQRYEDQLSKLDIRKSKGMIMLDDSVTFSIGEF